MDNYTINYLVNIWTHFLIHWIYLLSTFLFLSVLIIYVCWVMWAPRNVITTADDPMFSRAIWNKNVNTYTYGSFFFFLYVAYLGLPVLVDRLISFSLSKNVFHLEFKEFYYKFKYLHLFKEVYKITFSSTSSMSSLLLGVVKVLLVARSFAWWWLFMLFVAKKKVLWWAFYCRYFILLFLHYGGSNGR